MNKKIKRYYKSLFKEHYKSLFSIVNLSNLIIIGILIFLVKDRKESIIFIIILSIFLIYYKYFSSFRTISIKGRILHTIEARQEKGFVQRITLISLLIILMMIAIPVFESNDMTGDFILDQESNCYNYYQNEIQKLQEELNATREMCEVNNMDKILWDFEENKKWGGNIDVFS